MNGPSQEIDQKNLISAIALSVGILMIWQYFNPPPPPVEMQNTTAVVKTQDVSTQPKPQEVTNAQVLGDKPTLRPEVPLESYTVENSLQQVTLANRDAAIQNWILKNEQYAVKTAKGLRYPDVCAFKPIKRVNLGVVPCLFLLFAPVL